MSDHPSLALSEQCIDLWLAYYHEITNPQLLANLRELLSDAERKQEKLFHFADDRLRYLVTRAMVRTVLSRYAAVAPADWTFSKNAYGRPEIASRHGAPGLCFNISHTRGLIALGVSKERALGVDVENVVVRQPSIGIAEHFFSPVEVTELLGQPDELRQARFFEYWTFKESYIKARGMGLSLPLDKFSFRFPGQRTVRIAIDDELGDDENRWFFWQCRPTPAYLLALCAERKASPAPLITVREIVPTVASDIVAATWTKTSE